MNFICYPKCTTCQKAKKWLDANGVSYDLRDIKEQNPSYEELKNKLPEMSEEEQLRLLATDGMLVKRPILINGSKVVVGFKESDYEEAVK